MNVPATHPDPGAGKLDEATATEIAGCASPYEPPSAVAGQRVGPFSLVRELGHGGMGVVYLADQPSLGRQVAVKLLPAAKLVPGRLGRFRDEVRAVARLHHTNIVPVFEVGEEDGVWYYAMPYIAGRSLDRLASDGPLAPERIARIGAQAAAALAHAHDRGVLHRDVKPANLLLDESDRVWVTDFGVAKFFEEQGPATGTIVGTPRYMSPEQLEGRADPRTDVYGLGVTLYELATGRPLFADGCAATVFDAVRTAEPPAPRAVRPDLPADLDTIIVKAIAKEPRDRYASAGDLAADLERFLCGEPIVARRAGRVERLRKWARRRPALAGLVAVSGLALVALIAGGVYHTHTLRAALTAETAARTDAAARAGEARDRLELALSAHRQLITEVRALGRYPETRAAQQRLLKTALAGLEVIARSYESSAANLDRAEAHRRFGLLYSDLGDKARAIAQFESAAAIARPIVAAAADDLQARLTLCRVLGALTQTFTERQRIDDAERTATEMVAVADAAPPAAADDIDFACTSILAHLRLGTVFVWKREFTRARPVLDAAHGQARRLAERHPGDQTVKYAFGEALDRLRALSEAEGDKPRTRDVLLVAAPHWRAMLAERPDEARLKRSLMASVGNLGAVYRELNDPAAARPYLVEAERLAGELAAADPALVQYQCDCAMAAMDLADLEKAVGRTAEARGWYQKARDRLAELKAAGKLTDQPHFRDELPGMIDRALAELPSP